MQQIKIMDKYPLFTKEINKSNTKLKSIDEILNHIEDKISSHLVAVYIGRFDHYSHTSNLKDGEISEDIIDAKNIIFCFGKKLLKPELLGVRPRSIGVAETDDKFIVSFLQAPNIDANNSMMDWVNSITL